MKTIIFLCGLLVTCLAGFSQSKFYATVFDEDNLPVARGIFQSATDSGILILVENMYVLVCATEITTLKIEKNPSTSEFLKLGATAATEFGSYLINKPKKLVETHETESEDPTQASGEELQDSDSGEISNEVKTETVAFSTETKQALLSRLQFLIRDLLDGINDIATFSINNSPEKFLSKLRLLQEYSIDKEVVAWAGAVDDESSGIEVEPGHQTGPLEGTIDTNQETITTDNGSTRKPKNLQIVPLNKGFHIIKKPVNSGIKLPGEKVVTVPKKPIAAPVKTDNVKEQMTIKEVLIKPEPGNVKEQPVNQPVFIETKPVKVKEQPVLIKTRPGIVKDQSVSQPVLIKTKPADVKEQPVFTKNKPATIKIPPKQKTIIKTTVPSGKGKA